MVGFMDSNENSVTRAELRLQVVIEELDITVDGLLDKANFVLMELAEGLKDSQKHIARRVMEAGTYANIACDYIVQAQSTLTSIIEQRQEPPAGDAQEIIIGQIQNIKDSKLLTKILSFIESWTEDEGGQEDE